ncbi:MAG: hypothetical protein ACJA0Y_000632 [Maricaulis maris]|jgi:hypothetical protein
MENYSQQAFMNVQFQAEVLLLGGVPAGMLEFYVAPFTGTFTEGDVYLPDAGN